MLAWSGVDMLVMLRQETPLNISFFTCTRAQKAAARHHAGKRSARSKLTLPVLPALWRLHDCSNPSELSFHVIFEGSANAFLRKLARAPRISLAPRQGTKLEYTYQKTISTMLRNLPLQKAKEPLLINDPPPGLF